MSDKFTSNRLHTTSIKNTEISQDILKNSIYNENKILSNSTWINFPKHPFHLVEESPWPIITAYSLLTLTLSAVAYLQGYPLSYIFLILGFVSVAYCMALWFKDIIAEGTWLGLHTSYVQKGLALGVAFFVISEVFFFISIFWAYFHSSLAPAVELGAMWPPLGIQSINPYELALLNTGILLSSGAWITLSHHSTILNDKSIENKKNSRKFVILGFIGTIALAVLFTRLQIYEYFEAPFTISDSVYGTTFFFGTGFHGIHVLIGTIFILVQGLRILFYHVTDTHHFGLEGSIIYWHFVDFVWLVLYVCFYLWGA